MLSTLQAQSSMGALQGNRLLSSSRAAALRAAVSAGAAPARAALHGRRRLSSTSVGALIQSDIERERSRSFRRTVSPRPVLLPALRAQMRRRVVDAAEYSMPQSGRSAGMPPCKHTSLRVHATPFMPQVFGKKEWMNHRSVSRYFRHMDGERFRYAQRSRAATKCVGWRGVVTRTQLLLGDAHVGLKLHHN